MPSMQFTHSKQQPGKELNLIFHEVKWLHAITPLTVFVLAAPSD